MIRSRRVRPSSAPRSTIACKLHDWLPSFVAAISLTPAHTLVIFSSDTLPHPIAQGLFADAVSRVYDGGLHRDNRNAAGLGDMIELEVRKVCL